LSFLAMFGILTFVIDATHTRCAGSRLGQASVRRLSLDSSALSTIGFVR
jgi:hypothetical protein